MSRRIPLVLSASLLALGLVAPGAGAVSSYCGESGDVCTSVPKRKGVQRLVLGTFSFQGKVKICVTPPKGSRTCKSFTLRTTTAGIYEVDVRWSQYFPNRGSGTYRTTFTPSVTGTRYGPALTFRR